MVCIFVCCFLYCNLLQLTKVAGLLLPFLYIHTCVIFNKCIQTLKKTVSDLAHSTASVQNNILSKTMILVVKQNDMLLNLISDIPVNVSDINEKVIKLERKFLIM